MLRLGFEPTILVFERAKTVHPLDRAATVIGRLLSSLTNKSKPRLLAHSDHMSQPLQTSPFNISYQVRQLVAEAQHYISSLTLYLPLIGNTFLLLGMRIYSSIAEHWMSVIVVYYCTHYPAMGCLPRKCLRGNMFIEPLPSSETIRHNTVACPIGNGTLQAKFLCGRLGIYYARIKMYLI
jgi:hypothetical protein